MLFRIVSALLGVLSIPEGLARKVGTWVVSVYLIALFFMNGLTVSKTIFYFLWWILKKVTFSYQMDYVSAQAETLFTEIVNEVIQPTQSSTWEWIGDYKEPQIWLDFQKLNYYIVGLSMIIFLTMTYLMYVYGRRVSYKIRGIKYESLQPGSEFVTGNIPGYQISVYKPGLLMNTFVGYAVRVDMALCIPTHVLAQCGGTAVVGNKRIITKWDQSCKLADVSYAMLTEAQFSELGLRKPSIGTVSGYTVAACSGMEGASSGNLRRMSTIGMLSYSGSTIPGYSGAAYYDKNVLFGMHTGESGSGINCGVAAVFLAAEIKARYLEVIPEARSKKMTNVTFFSNPAQDTYTADRVASGPQSTWSDRQVIDLLQHYYTRKAQGDVMWADEEVDDPTAFYESEATLLNPIEEALSELTPQQVKRLFLKFIKQEDVNTYKGQGTDGVEVNISGMSAQKMGYDLLAQRIDELSWGHEDLTAKHNTSVAGFREVEERVHKMHSMFDSFCLLSDRMAKLENEFVTLKSMAPADKVAENKQNMEEEKEKRINSLKRPKGSVPVNPFPCEYCERSFTSELGVLTHRHSKHGKPQEVVANPESAFPSDHDTLVKKTFLGKRNFRKLNTRSRDSRLEREHDQFSLLSENLSKMTDLLMKQSVNLENLVKKLDGPSSEKKQN